MKNLWLFLSRYNAIFGLLFFVVAIVLVVRNNSYQRASFLNSSNVMVGSFYKQVNSWKSYLALADANEKLTQENVLLRQQVQNMIQANPVVDSVHLVDSIEQGRYAFIIANVANNSIHQKK